MQLARLQSLIFILAPLLTRRGWRQCWPWRTPVPGSHCPLWRCPGWTLTCRKKFFLQTEGKNWVNKSFINIRIITNWIICPYICKAGCFLPICRGQELSALLSFLGLVQSVGEITSYFSGCRRSGCAFVVPNTMQWGVWMELDNSSRGVPYLCVAAPFLYKVSQAATAAAGKTKNRANMH